MKKILSIALIAFSFQAMAEVDPSQVETMLKQMVSESVISADEAGRATARLKALSPEQWKAINEKASSIASRTPASANGTSNNKIEEVNSIDLDGAQFKQIQNDLRTIVPQSQD
jgi:DNA-binding PadR family transcriptional regulator